MDRQYTQSVGKTLWRRKWIVVVAAFVALAASLAISVIRTPMYQAEAQLVKDQGSLDITLFGTSIYSAGDVERDLVTTADSVTSLRIASLVKEAVGSELSAGQLLGMVTANASDTSNTITIEATGPDPQETAELANAFATQTILLRQESDKAALVAARQALEAQIAMMTPTDLESSLGQQLQARVEQLGVLEQVQTGGYVLWQSAQTPQTPVSPRPARDTAAGLAAGVILGLILAVSADRLDRRLKGQADFEREFRMPVLALIPRIGRRWKRSEDNGSDFIGFAAVGSPFVEAHRLLRSNLQYFEGEKALRSILVTSGLPQEAKTSTAVNLALSLAMSGEKVALVDTDLRNPLMDRYLNLDNSVGLSTLLAGTIRVEEAARVVKTSDFLPKEESWESGARASDKSLQKDFICVTSGPLPPNPAELLASPRMGETLKALMSLVDYVLIDSAPILVVADAVGLASRVDGVIVVSREGSATIEQAHDIRTTLERVGARLVGLVITGVKVSSSHGYQSGYYRQKGN
jgi:Mrp family chromosome partitioning ATPase